MTTMPFRITRKAIEAHLLARPDAGALASFEGRVRNHHEGRQVVKLEYEAYEDLAVKEGEKVLQEARQRFAVLDVECTHRIGELQIGDVAVRVDVLAGHRQEAFEACSWIIDAVKERVPIWKKETYAEGDHGWVNAEPATGEMDGAVQR